MVAMSGKAGASKFDWYYVARVDHLEGDFTRGDGRGGGKDGIAEREPAVFLF